jgi:hypothetical protein
MPTVMRTDDELAQAIASAARHRLAEALAKIKHCLIQLTDEQLWWRPQDSQNKHRQSAASSVRQRSAVARCRDQRRARCP